MSRLEPTGITQEKQLLVEGNDPRNFFEAFARHLSLQNMQIQNFGGVNDLRYFLSLLRKMPGTGKISSIGIVRDAEDSAQSAFESVQSALENAGLPAPRRAGQRLSGEPAVSVAILPDNERPGMLETLLCRTFAGAAEDKCIDDYLACVGALPGVTVKRPDKARVHAWLAAKPDPHVSAGVAAKKGYWDFDHDAFADLRAFLTQL